MDHDKNKSRENCLNIEDIIAQWNKIYSRFQEDCEELIKMGKDDGVLIVQYENQKPFNLVLISNLLLDS